MSLSTAPVAPRLARPRWRDPKLVFGLLLVLVSIVLGSRIIAGADATVPVWSVTSDLGPGNQLSTSDLAVRHVRIEGGLDRYVGAVGGPPAGRRLNRPLSKGELLPVAALTQDSATTSVPLQVLNVGGLARGSVVDVYVLPESTGMRQQNNPRPSGPLVRAATIDRLEQSRSSSSSSAREVSLLVPNDRVAELLLQSSTGSVHLTVPHGAGTPATPAAGGADS